MLFKLILFLWIYRIESIADVEYEQVIADRYLFSSYQNESTWWNVLQNISSSWQIVSLPEYHSQSSNGFWLLTENNKSLSMCYMSINGNETLICYSEINVSSKGSYLISSNNRMKVKDFNVGLISEKEIQLIECDIQKIELCQIKKIIPFPSSISEKTKQISSSLFVWLNESYGYLYIGSDSGLHLLNLQTFEILPYFNGINVPISSLEYSLKYESVFIGTEMKLWIGKYLNESIDWRYEHVNGLIDTPITSLVYDHQKDQLWIGQSTGITLLIPIELSNGNIHWYFSRLSGQISSPGSYIGHLPLLNITRLSRTSNDNSIWLGSVYGLMRYNVNRKEWRVFNSGRYLPNRLSQVDISSLIVLNRNSDDQIGCTAVGITNRGLTIIRFEKWTLKKKATFFQNYIDQSNHHVRYNLVSDCTMSKWGDPRTCVKGPNDNDGLWTSMYLGSQIFRYLTTNDSQIRDSSWKYFQGLYSLNKVTGIVGYPSRSIARRDEFPPTEDWYPSPVNSSLQFKGDTSSDEIVGHEFVYPLVIDYLSRNEIERQEAYEVLLNISEHILSHNWYLIGENGNHTMWGIWNPSEINENSFYQESRGLNSLQILSFLLQSFLYSKDQKYLDGINLLINEYHYDTNLINQKMIAMCDTDFSDDELAYLSYFNFAYTLKKMNSSDYNLEMLEEYMKIGLDLSHRYKQMEKSPFYNWIYCYIYNGNSSTFDCQKLINDSIWYLQRFPLELIDWPQYNSQRFDIHLNKESSCFKNEINSIDLLPPDERSAHKWNGGVFDLDDGNGFNEDDPTTFLLPYWGLTFSKFLDF